MTTENPCEGNLRCGGVVLRSYILEFLDQGQVVREVLVVETWDVLAEVIGLEVGARFVSDTSESQNRFKSDASLEKESSLPTHHTWEMSRNDS